MKPLMKPLLFLLSAAATSVVMARYPDAKIVQLEDGVFYKVPIATIDGRYEELEIEVSPRRFVFCSAERATGPLQQQLGVEQMLECVIERGGTVSMAKLAYMPVQAPGAKPSKMSNAQASARRVDRVVDGKSYYEVPVSTLTKELDSIEKEVSEDHYLFCSKIRREPDGAAPQHELQCIVEKDGQISRTRETFQPTASELKALAEYQPPDTETDTPRSKGPYHGI